jgi:hypothetical protein
MALRAAERGKLPVTRDGLAKSSSAVRAAAVAARAIPLKLAPLLQPYRKEGRLSLRVEHMQQRARLSRGRNNGDGSWSLASDELDDLEYLSPEGMGDAQSLSVRIIGLDQDGTTLAILEVPLLHGGKPASAGQGGAATAVARDQDALIERQRDELKSLKSVLAEREAELANIRHAAERKETELSPDNLASELAAARESWKRELEQRLADAAAQSTATLERAQTTWQAEQAALIAKAEKRTDDRVAEAEERSRREAKDTLVRTEAAWKAAEAKRLADSEAGWREKSASALTEAAARCERAEKLLSEARAKGPAKPTRDDAENRRLREELTTLRAALVERDSSLVRVRSEAERERERLRREQETALSNATTVWKDAEAARSTSAEALWRKQFASVLAEQTARCNRAEAALAETRARAGAAAKSARDEAVHRLREELAALREALSDRDAALDQARLDAEQSLQRARRDSEATLAQAQTRWKDEETARLAASEAQWRTQSERVLSEMSARCERADEALSDAQAEVAVKSVQDASEERRLCEELASLHAVLGDRDMALAQTRLTAERALQRVQQEADRALAKAQASWKAEETARLSAAEAQWRKQSASALAEATARFKEAETALAHIRIRGGGHEKGESETVSALRGEIAVLQSALADRDNDLLHARPTPESREASSPRIAIRENHDWESAELDEKTSKTPRRLIRDVVVVAALAASAIIFWPRLESYVPAGWLPGAAESSSTTDAQVRLPAPVAAPVPLQRMAIVIRAANVRADPAKTATVMSTLQHGMQVATIGERNNWTLVRIDTKGSKPQQGWVYSSFLKNEPDGEKPSLAAKR